MTRCLMMCIWPLFSVTVAWGQPAFFDDFEPNGVDRAVWTKWPEADEILFSDSTQNHTSAPGAKWCARAVEADPWGYAMYADFGSTGGPVYAEVWVWDELDDEGTNPARPVSNMLALVGAAPYPASWTDYLQLGVVAWYDPAGLSETYSVRTKRRDLSGPMATDYVDLGVPRKPGWTKLAIAADALADGGNVRFYIDDQPVFTSWRVPGVSLQYVRLGVNFKSYDPFLYDDVAVTDALPPDTFVRFDADGDGDVDQIDFAAFQLCRAEAVAGYGDPDCWRMDADEDGDVDVDDHAAFEACASGPAIMADPACDR